MQRDDGHHHIDHDDHDDHIDHIDHIDHDDHDDHGDAVGDGCETGVRVLSGSGVPGAGAGAGAGDHGVHGAGVHSASINGIEGHPVVVEVHVANGLPGFTLVGNTDTSTREARDRVRAAVLSSGLSWPTHRITVNIAPASRRKMGTSFDLAIAVGVLVASGQVPAESVLGLGFLGELGLDGRVRPVSGVAPMVACLPADIVPVVPVGGRREAEVVRRAGRRSHDARDTRVHTVDTLARLVSVLAGHEPWPDLDEPCDTSAHDASARDASARDASARDASGSRPSFVRSDASRRADAAPAPDLADVRGQAVARRALEIAAAGGHNLFLVGAPGSGKTMLAQRLPGILPALGGPDALAATMIRSAAGLALPADGLVALPPFRAPHHTVSKVAMVGGGHNVIRPGEVSLAHGGVLFLDEMGEFSPQVLDALRQPMEEGIIHISRVAGTADIPARFLLVGASNPCPCGGGPPGSCTCDEASRTRYLRRLSGPLLDRFDLRVVVRRPDVDALLGDRHTAGEAEPSHIVARRVAAARRRALRRQGTLNARLAADQLDRVAPLSPAAKAMLRAHLEADRLTGRGYHRVRRVARTIADLAGLDDGGDVADVAGPDGLDGLAGLDRLDDGDTAVVSGERDVIDVEHVAMALALRADVAAGRRVTS